MEKLYIIAGHKNMRFPKTINSKQAKKHQSEGKKVYNSRPEAVEGIEKGEE